MTEQKNEGIGDLEVIRGDILTRNQESCIRTDTATQAQRRFDFIKGYTLIIQDIDYHDGEPVAVITELCAKEGPLSGINLAIPITHLSRFFFGKGRVTNQEDLECYILRYPNTQPKAPQSPRLK